MGPKKFKSPGSLKTFKSRHFCESCREFYPSRAALHRHYAAVHKPIYTTTRPKIRFDFNAMSKKGLKERKNKSLEEDQQPQLQASAELMETEVAETVPNNEEGPSEQQIVIRTEVAKKKPDKFNFHCRVCPSKFISESGFKRHQEEHSALFKCFECQEDVEQCKYFQHLVTHAKIQLSSSNSKVVYSDNDNKDVEMEDGTETVETETVFHEILLPARRFVYFKPGDPRSGTQTELFWCKTCCPIKFFYKEEGLLRHYDKPGHSGLLEEGDEEDSNGPINC